MRKSKDISKYDIHWQVFRVSLKSKKDVQAKLVDCFQYLHDHPTRANKERILNFLEGLSMPYKNRDATTHNRIVDAMDVMNLSIPVSNDISTSEDFGYYNNITLMKVYKDINVRNKKWMNAGYRHEGQIHFMKGILKHVGNYTMLRDLENDIEKSKDIKNTHNFFF